MDPIGQPLGASTSRLENYSSASRENWHSNSKRNLCPICGRATNCKVSSDGSAVWCGRISDGSTATNNGGQFLHLLERRQDWLPPAEPIRTSKPAPRPPRDWSARIRAGIECRNRDARLNELAEELSGDSIRPVVSVDVLRSLDVGYGIADGCWLLPERDGRGRVVGINRRYRDGSKRQVKGSARGLTFAPSWASGAGPVFIAEGASDTAAGLTAGLRVIGRPSNGGGADHLVELLRSLPRDQSIIVLGENDRKPHAELKTAAQERHDAGCGGCSICWPGMAGRRVAERLANELLRPIGFALPPGGEKDLRTWAITNADQPAAEFIAALQVETISPPPVEIIADPVGPVVELGKYREALRRSRVRSIGKPGVRLDTSPTGSGKTFADLEAVAAVARRGGSALLVLPTHANCREVVADLGRLGIEATAYPERRGIADDSPNCWNRAADAAEAVGLPVLSTVCASCPSRARCRAEGGYLRDLQVANASPVKVATHARAAAAGLRKLAGGAEYVAVHESARGLLRPSVEISPDDLRKLTTALHHLLDAPDFLDEFGSGKKGPGRFEFVKHLAKCVVKLTDSVEGSNQTRDISPPAAMRRPAGIERLLLQAGRDAGVRFDGQPWRPLLAFASGQLDRMAVVVDHRLSKGGERVPSRSLLAVWRNDVPTDAAVWFGDATADADRLAKLIDAPVSDCTPPGRIENVKKAIQLPRDISRSTSPDVAVNLVRGVMADRPEAKRIGIICHAPHTRAFEKLAAEDGRISMVRHFGSGDDRSSNEWPALCDLLIVAGTPRVGTAAVRAHLTVSGEIEAAAIEDPGWGPLVWLGRSEAGEGVRVASKNYAHPAWRAATNDIVRASLIQAIGRGRGLLSTGIEVVALSCDECGLPISDRRELRAINGTAAECVRLVAALTVDGTPVLTKAIAAEVGISDRTVREYLTAAEETGLVRRVSARGGWLPVAPVADAAPVESSTEIEPHPPCPVGTPVGVIPSERHEEFACEDAQTTAPRVRDSGRHVRREIAALRRRLVEQFPTAMMIEKNGRGRGRGVTGNRTTLHARAG